MLRAIIVEDIPLIREQNIALLAEHCPQVKIIAEIDNVIESIAAINKLSPDLVLLDIDIKGGSAFDIIKELQEPLPNIIFTTAHDTYAVQAFGLSAIDYLLKPIDAPLLIKAVQKTEEKISSTDLMLKMQTLLKNIQNPKDLGTIVLRTFDKVHIVKLSDVVRCEANDSYTFFYLVNNSKIVVSAQLKEYENILSSQNFYRPHKSHLINLSFIDHVLKTDSGIIVMKDKTQIPIAVRKKEEFFKLLDGL